MSFSPLQTSERTFHNSGRIDVALDQGQVQDAWTKITKVVTESDAKKLEAVRDDMDTLLVFVRHYPLAVSVVELILRGRLVFFPLFSQLSSSKATKAFERTREMPRYESSHKSLSN